MATLSLDLGTLCGWCIKKNDGLILSGHINTTPLPPTKKREKEHIGLRFHKFDQLLSDLNRCYGTIKEVIYEDVKRQTGATANTWPGFRAITEMFAYKIGAVTYPYGVGVIKLESVGMGKASKEATLLFANKWLGREIESEDEGDAICAMYTHLKKTCEL